MMKIKRKKILWVRLLMYSLVMGHRCEVEATGYASCYWWGGIQWLAFAYSPNGYFVGSVSSGRRAYAYPSFTKINW